MKGKVISIMTEKGGVGKTTTAVALGYALSEMKKKVCILDFDAQGNATILSGFTPEDLEITINEIINCGIQDEPYPEETNYLLKVKDNLYLIPANERLMALQNNLTNATFRETKLKDFIDSIRSNFDYIIIDCMPNLGTPMVNAMFASDEIIMPCNSDGFSLNAFQNMKKHFDLVKRNGNSNLKIAGVLITKFQKNTNASKGIRMLLDENYGKNTPIYNNTIPFSVKVSESSFAKKCIIEYMPQNIVSLAYKSWVKEFLEMEKCDG